VATLLGRWDVNINRLETAGKDQHASVVDFLLEFPDDLRRQSALEELAALEGVTLEWVHSYPYGGGLRYDLEVMQRMFCSDTPPAQVIATSAPLLCGAGWALLLDTSSSQIVMRTPGAPEVEPGDLTGLGPFNETHASHFRTAPDDECSTPVAVIALPAHQALLVGRPDGPEFAASELARLDYLSRAASGSCPSALGGSGPLASTGSPSGS
jgi:hypothetical protein